MQRKRIKFYKRLEKLDPSMIIGVAKLLNIKIVDEKNKPRDFINIIPEMGKAYEKLTKIQRKNLDAILWAAIYGDDKNGASTKNS